MPRFVKDRVRNPGTPTAEPLRWSVDHHSHCRGHLYVDGWAYHPHARVRSMSVLLPDGQVIPADG
ncbi:MAG TPA: hypothetical protein VG205_07535, partial [Acidimicrobiales bacterium]|nr:hypothetical protein [Acidimicrobiales bacterium]